MYDIQEIPIHFYFLESLFVSKNGFWLFSKAFSACIEMIYSPPTYVEFY